MQKRTDLALELRENIIKNAQDKKGEIDENLNLIFGDLSSLHASIADLQESADGYAGTNGWPNKRL